MIPGRARSWRKRVLAMGDRGPSRRLGTGFDKGASVVPLAPLICVPLGVEVEAETMFSCSVVGWRE